MAPEHRPVSIIIPAHNEANVIERCLREVVSGAAPGELEVIVVCNGCTDGTATAARRVGGPVRVLETPISSKVHALNLGDRAARGFPRFYIDADIVVTLDAVRSVSAVLETGTCSKSRCMPRHERDQRCADCPAVAKRRILAAAPRMHVRRDHCDWFVRAFYEIWTRLPYCTDGMIGSGFYALSEEGRRRFDTFPPVISDDGFVRLLFKPGERATVGCGGFELSAPRNLRSLLKIKTRSQFDNYQLHRMFPPLRSNEQRDYRPFLRQLLTQPRLWPQLAVYCLVIGTARARALWRLLWGHHSTWDRDESSRCG